jgi:two-component system invasion response regulator UvrY
MIRMIIADDHELIRAGLCRLMETEPDIQVLGQAGTGRGAVDLCRELRPDVALLDFAMPDMDGIEATRQIISEKLGARVLILTMHDNEEYAIRLIQAGASGFIVKGTSPDELITAIRRVAEGKTYITPSILEAMTFRSFQDGAENPLTLLSDRELQVLIRLARGQVNKEISEELCISVSTVETYRKRIFDKLGLRNLSDITRFAIRYGLIDQF